MRALISLLLTISTLGCTDRARPQSTSANVGASATSGSAASTDAGVSGASNSSTAGALASGSAGTLGAAANSGAPSSSGAGTGGASAGIAAAGHAAQSGSVSAGPAADGGMAGAVGASGSAGNSGATQAFPDVAFAGLLSALELAPVRLAANGLYPAHVSLASGGVDNLFSAGGALLASNAETQALRASVQHANLRIIFTVCEGLYRIVAKKSSGISTLADLRGKRIAVPRGTSSEYYLSRMLSVANLTEQDVSIISESPGMAALAADAATIWEPGIQYVADQLASDAIEFQNDPQGSLVYRELFNLHATAESLANPDKRRAIVEFVRALIEASQQIRQDPSAAWALLKGPTGESASDLQKSWKYERFAGSLASDVLDVLAAEEPWRAAQDGRTARTRAALSALVDDSVFKEASGM
jgi:NitT/TauT family transport system substrate-binding protein